MSETRPDAASDLDTTPRRSRQLPPSIERAGRAVAVLVTVSVLSLGLSVAPASAGLSAAIPMNQLEEPTFEFTDQDALLVYVLSDIKGGTVCLVDAAHEDPAGLSCTANGVAWADPNTVVGIGTTILPIEEPPLVPGTYKILSEDSEHQGTGLSQTITVTACPTCDRRLAQDVVQRWKATAEVARVGMGITCVGLELKDLHDEVTAARGGAKNATDRADSYPSTRAGFSATVAPSPGGLRLAFTAIATEAITAGQDKALEILKDLSCAAATMYADIVADPPDPDFATVEAPSFRVIAPLGSTSGDALAAALDRQTGHGLASLTAFERYLGATAAGDDAAVVRQLDAVAAFSFEAAEDVQQTAAAMRAHAAELAGLPTYDRPVVTEQSLSDVRAVRQRVTADGFTADEIAQLTVAGFTGLQVDQLRTHFTPAALEGLEPGTTLPALLVQQAAVLAEQADGLREFGKHAAVTSARAQAVGPNLPPSASVEVDAPRTEGRLLTLTSGGSMDPDGSIVRRDWDFGDGGTFPDGGAEVVHAYRDEGTYSVRLTVTDDAGAASSVTHDVVVANAAPTLSAQVPTRVPPGATRDYAVSVTDPGEDDVHTVTWDFGDGSAPVLDRPALGQPSTVQHRYETAGTYELEVSVDDGDGGTSTVKRTVEVSAPVADAGPDQSVDEGDPVQLGGPASSAAGPLIGHSWDFGDGTSGAGRTPEHRYHDDGVYTARLTVSDSDLSGTSVTDSAVITVANVAPTASVLLPSAARPGETISLRAFGKDPGSQDVLAYQWDLGDGATATGTRVEHAFPTGSHTVTLTVSDGDGGSSTVTRSIAVAAEPPGDGQRDSRGTDFWLAFMPGLDTDDPQLFVSAELATEGVVEVPGLGFSAPFDVASGGVARVHLPRALVQAGAGAPSPHGVHVRAGRPVAVYGLNQGPVVTDGFLGLPREALGQEYYAVGHDGFSGGEVAVLATRNDTTVTLRDRDGRELTRTLDAGDVHALYAGHDDALGRGPSGALDFTGVRITADKPVAAYSGAFCGNVPSDAAACNHLVEQLPPTSQWGRSFVATPFATREDGDLLRVVASAPGTQVTVDGTVVATLDAGQYHERLLHQAARIETSKPVLIAHFAHSSTYDFVTGDPTMSLLVPTEQQLSSYLVATPREPFLSHWVNVVTPSSAVGTVQLDGEPVPARSFTAVGTSGWSWAQIQVSAGVHRLSAPVRFGLAQYGWGEFDAYGWPGGSRFPDLGDVSSLSLAPEETTADVGARTCLTATAATAGGQPVADLRVDWTITGTQTVQGASHTDDAGEAQVCATGTGPGQDLVTVRSVGLTDSATITWTAATAPKATDATVVTAEDTPVDLMLQATGGTAQPLSFVVVQGPRHGALTGTPPRLTYTPAPGFSGPDSFTFTAAEGARTSAPATVGITVTEVDDPPVVRTDTPTRQAQFSDMMAPVTVSVRDEDSTATSLAATLSWKLATEPAFRTGAPLHGLQLDPGADVDAHSRTWTIRGRALTPAGDYVVRVTAGDGQAVQHVDLQVVVTAEDADLDYTGVSLVPTDPAGVGSARVAATATEAADGVLGDQLGGTSMRFRVFRSADVLLTAPVATCTGAVTRTAPGAGQAGCELSGLAPDTYTVETHLVSDGRYSAAAEYAALTVATPSTGSITGGGWLIEPTSGTRSNLGFTAKVLKSGRLQGNSVHIHRRTVAAGAVADPSGGYLPAGEYVWMVKSNALSTLSTTCTGSVPNQICSAALTGKATVTAVHRTSGQAYGLGGNYLFQLDVTDRGEPGAASAAASDSYALRVTQAGNPYYQLGRPAAQAALQGGNVQVRP